MPIPGTRKLERVEENLGAAHIVLTHEDLAEMQAATLKISVQGARLPEAILQLSYR